MGSVPSGRQRGRRKKLVEVLIYTLEQGPTERTIIEQSVRQRLPLPDRIANAPELFPGLDIYYTAFLDLTTCRQLGYGAEGPISWLVIDEYADRSGFEGEQREDLFYHVQEMDRAYVQHMTSKANKGKGSDPKKQRE